MLTYHFTLSFCISILLIDFALLFSARVNKQIRITKPFTEQNAGTSITIMTKQKTQFTKKSTLDEIINVYSSNLIFTFSIQIQAIKLLFGHSN